MSINYAWTGMYQTYQDEGVHHIFALTRVDRTTKNYSEWGKLADVCFNNYLQVR